MSEEAPVKKEIKIPLTIVEAVTTWPTELIIFTKPKCGKTTLVAELKDCLILGLEKGSKYVSALKIEAENINDIKEIGKQIKEAGYPYKFIAIDTVTALEDMCIPYAEVLYSRSPMGAKWFEDSDLGGKKKYGDILGLPNGGGYHWLRQAFTKTIDYVKTWAPNVILLAHVKDTVLEKAGAEHNTMDLDLTGKLKRIAASKSDAIGYMYRKGKQNLISFKTTDEIACGARPEHLKNQEFVISEEVDGKLIAYWDKIYPQPKTDK